MKIEKEKLENVKIVRSFLAGIVELIDMLHVAVALTKHRFEIKKHCFEIMKKLVPAAQPLPAWAEGGYIKKRIPTIIGEDNDNEVIIPMESGTYEIADRILNMLRISNKQNQE